MEDSVFVGTEDGEEGTLGVRGVVGGRAVGIGGCVIWVVRVVGGVVVWRGRWGVCCGGGVPEGGGLGSRKSQCQLGFVWDRRQGEGRTS